MIQFRTANNLRIISVFLPLAVLLYNSMPAYSTGPFPPLARIFYTRYPDLPLNGYAGGKLGVLRPTFARSYLAVAYRYLDGKPLNSEERKSALDLWDFRLGLNEHSKAAAAVDAGLNVEKASKAWLAARRKVPGVKAIKSINVYGTYNHGIISNYLSCSSNAFVNAVSTLHNLIQTFGLKSRHVKDWVVAQDTVFSNLSADQHHEPTPDVIKIPQPLPTREKSALLKAARNYQIASANFYAQKYDKAETQFTAIAKDRQSPWRRIAPYLAVRAVIRKSSLQRSDKDGKLLHRAEMLLQKQLAGEKDMRTRKDITTLLRLVHCRQQRIGELSDSVAMPSGSQFGQHLDDYTLTLDAMLKYAGQSELKWTGIPGKVKTKEMTDWILAFQCPGIPAFAHCMERWQKTKSLPWLLATLSKAEPKDKGLAQLLEAANKVSFDSPAYLSISYHLVRLQSQIDKVAQARKRLQAIASKSGQLPLSTVNEFKELRARTADSVKDLVRDCVINPATIGVGESDLPLRNAKVCGTNSPQIFDSKTVDILNKNVPLSLFKKVASNPVLSARLRQEALANIWVRAVLLGDDSVSVSVSKQLMQQSPAFNPYLKSWLNAGSAAEKKYLSAYFILKFPGLRPYLTGGLPRPTPVNKIDTYQENWWKDAKGDPSMYEDYGDPDLHRGVEGPVRGDLPPLRPPAFLTSKERSRLAAEMKSLTAVSPAPNYLCAQIISWSKEKPNDPRVPEALHLAVVATRYGATDDGTSKYSKQAFQILHKKYPKNQWTKKTPYSF